MFCCIKPVTSLLNSKNKEGSLHCMLTNCSRWDAACAGTAAERDGTKSLIPRRAALACVKQTTAQRNNVMTSKIS